MFFHRTRFWQQEVSVGTIAPQIHDRSRSFFAIVLGSEVVESWYILVTGIMLYFLYFFSTWEKGGFEMLFFKNFSYLCREFQGVI